MAFDNFIGWSQMEKISMLRAVQEARLTGQVVSLQTANGVKTDFNPASVNVGAILRELEISIATSPQYDANDPVQLACFMNQRPGRTTPVFY